VRVPARIRAATRYPDVRSEPAGGATALSTAPGPVPSEPKTTPGLRAQFARAREAAKRLAGAHLDLLKAEVGEIVAEIKQIAALAGVIVAFAVFAGMLASIGGALFIGEWIFGSIGWGVVHGVLSCVALIVVAAFAIIEAPRRIAIRAFVMASIVAILVAAALGANLARQGATWAADQLRAGPWPGLDPGWAPAIAGILAGAAVIALIGLVALAFVGGLAGAITGLVLGAMVGALLGWALAGIEFGWQGAAAIGVTLGLAAWPALMGIGLVRAREFDPTARFRRLVPQQSIDAANETKTWLEEQWAQRRGKRGIE
jgi:hypothetical protein